MPVSQWVTLGGFLGVLAVLLLALARLDVAVSAALLATFGTYWAVVLHGAHRRPALLVRRRVRRPAPDGRPRRTRPGIGPR